MSNLSLKQQLSQEQLAVVQSEMELKKKSMVVAYLFAFFLGIFGAHRFYVGKTGTAVAQWCSPSSELLQCSSMLDSF